MRHAKLASLLIVFAIGCRTQGVPVRIEGDPVSIAWLAGSWTGEYWGGNAARSGSLDFTLGRGTDSLYGDVSMVGATGQPLRPADPMDVHRSHVRAPQRLRIDFVAVHADVVQGTLEPYVSPDCECIVVTTFVGQVRGHAIAGMFATQSEGHVIAEGRWEMHRVEDDGR
jgi:hypothetical protein